MVEQKVSQTILPGMQETLGVSKSLDHIPVKEGEVQIDSERMFGLTEVKQVMVNLGISTEETVDQTIKTWQRETRFGYVNDAVMAALKVGSQTIMDATLRTKFEEVYGEKCTIDSLRKKGFGGNVIDGENANVDRSPEDLKLDDAVREKIAKEIEEEEEGRSTREFYERYQ